MPNAKNKMAAVPYVNDRGERSMKKVKVERYVAGKKPSFAHEDEDEYYTTDDEEADDEEMDEQEDGNEQADNDDDDDVKPGNSRRLKSVIANRFIHESELRISHEHDSDEDKDGEEEEEEGTKVCKQEQAQAEHEQDDSDEEMDDPRFRKLKQLQSKTISTNNKSKSTADNIVTFESRSGTILENDEDEPEDDIRQRHALARTRKLDQPIGPKAVLGDLDDQIQDLKSMDDEALAARLIDTDDLLSSFMPTTLKAEDLEAKDNEEFEERLKDQLEEVREQAILRAAVDKRVEEEIKMDEERLARSKAGDINTRDMNSVLTDDEDDQTGAEFEAWKDREINRIVRYKAEYLRYQQSLASCH